MAESVTSTVKHDSYDPHCGLYSQRPRYMLSMYTSTYSLDVSMSPWPLTTIVQSKSAACGIPDIVLDAVPPTLDMPSVLVFVYPPSSYQ